MSGRASSGRAILRLPSNSKEKIKEDKDGLKLLRQQEGD
jgi:hypothetical protein